MLKYVDHIFCVSAADMNFFKLFRKSGLYFLPCLNNQVFPKYQLKEDREVLHIVYMGTDYINIFNLTGLNYIIKHIIPACNRLKIKAIFHILGSSLPEEIKKLESSTLIFHDFVTDLDSFLSTITTAIWLWNKD